MTKNTNVKELKLPKPCYAYLESKKISTIEQLADQGYPKYAGYWLDIVTIAMKKFGYVPIEKGYAVCFKKVKKIVKTSDENQTNPSFKIKLNEIPQQYKRLILLGHLKEYELYLSKTSLIDRITNSHKENHNKNLPHISLSEDIKKSFEI